MSIAIRKNQQGRKSCYCWDGDVIFIDKMDGWQDVIYGYYHDTEDEQWCLGIKRNGCVSGRSAFYYQVVVQPMAQWILSEIKKRLPTKTEKEIIKMILDNYETPDDEIINKIEGLLNAS